ncbi:hypothetical protein V6N13_060828 [Hibiscus sabdariffa]|uniref:Uncharacterized protein n=1 Tax=Hibiscus sabdariffa TaxID=183260 RepID=A0ABR2P6J8_9ROSI
MSNIQFQISHNPLTFTSKQELVTHHSIKGRMSPPSLGKINTVRPLLCESGHHRNIQSIDMVEAQLSYQTCCPIKLQEEIPTTTEVEQPFRNLIPIPTP